MKEHKNITRKFTLEGVDDWIATVDSDEPDCIELKAGNERPLYLWRDDAENLKRLIDAAFAAGEELRKADEEDA